MGAPKKLTLETQDIQALHRILNEEVPQRIKKDVCSLIEGVLMRADRYGGFQYLYWSDRGCDEWYNEGCPEGWEKDQFIYGPNGALNRKNDNFVDALEGEFARHYFVKP